MIRGLLGVITGFLVWSVLWFFLNWLLPIVFPKQFNTDGTTENAILNLIIVLLSFDFSFISGYINAIISRVNQLNFALVQGVLQLAAGMYIQSQYWHVLPLWFHAVFLIFIIPGVLAGSLYRNVNVSRKHYET